MPVLMTSAMAVLAADIRSETSTAAIKVRVVEYVNVVSQRQLTLAQEREEPETLREGESDAAHQKERDHRETRQQQEPRHG